MIDLPATHDHSQAINRVCLVLQGAGYELVGAVEGPIEAFWEKSLENNACSRIYLLYTGTSYSIDIVQFGGNDQSAIPVRQFGDMPFTDVLDLLREWLE